MAIRTRIKSNGDTIVETTQLANSGEFRVETARDKLFFPLKVAGDNIDPTTVQELYFANSLATISGSSLLISLSGSTTSGSIATDIYNINSSIAILTASCAGTDNQLSAAITLLSSSVTSSFANLSHANLNNLGVDDHTQYLHISGTRAMAGPLDVGGYNLTNFVTTSSLNLPLASGSSLTQIFSYAPTMLDLSILSMGIRLIVWETATKNVVGAAETEVLTQMSSSILNIKGTPVFDKTSKGFPTTFDCSVTSSADAVVVLARPGSNAGAASIFVWHQNAIVI